MVIGTSPSGKPCKDVSESEALEYVYGYTGSNDVSSRKSQFEQSQWCFSKSFDGACPIGPCVVSPNLIPDPSKLKMRGAHNGEVVQESGLECVLPLPSFLFLLLTSGSLQSDLIFSVPKIISFLSQGTTLPPGTIILTGTPAGVGAMMSPKKWLKDGDEFSVEILPHIGTLVNVFKDEK